MASRMNPKNPIKTTERSLRIIEALRELEGAGVSEIARELEYDKATVHHHLSTLEAYDLVAKDGTKYHLGIRFFTLGEFVRRQEDIYEVAKQEIDALAQETGEIANLMVEEHGTGVYLYIARGKKAIKLDTKIGSRQYLHTSALGKAILATLTDGRVDDIIDQYGLPAETPKTVTCREKLENELSTIRCRGYAVDGEERAEGIRCVAAPITDNGGELAGAVSVSGPTARLKGEYFQETIPELVQDTASVIGINASYS